MTAARTNAPVAQPALAAPVTVHARAAASPSGIPTGFAAELVWDGLETGVAGGDTVALESARIMAALEALRVLNNSPQLDGRAALIHTDSETLHRLQEAGSRPPEDPDEAMFLDELLAEAEGRDVRWLRPDPAAPQHLRAQRTAERMVTGRGDEQGFFIHLPGPPRPKEEPERKTGD